MSAPKSPLPPDGGGGRDTSREDCGEGLLGEVTSELLEVLKGRCPSGRGRSKGPEKKPLLVAERRTEPFEAGPRSQVKEFRFHSNRVEPWEPFSKVTDLIH